MTGLCCADNERQLVNNSFCIKPGLIHTILAYHLYTVRPWNKSLYWVKQPCSVQTFLCTTPQGIHSFRLTKFLFRFFVSQFWVLNKTIQQMKKQYLFTADLLLIPYLAM